MPAIRLIVAADEPALFFSSIEAAERWLEAIDVRDGVYSALYGPGGEPFRIWAQDDRVLIAPEGTKPQPEKLRALLISFLGAVRQPVAENEPLPALLRRCEPYVAD